MKDKNVKPSFTPDEPEKVLQIIWENQTAQGREYAEKTSQQVGK
jgi:hypothetical protein